jgi:cell division septal protein FtsQ
VALLPYLATFGFAGMLFGASFAFALQSDLFTLRNVTLEDGKPLTPAVAHHFAGLRIGERILDTDLVRSERLIRSKHPEYQWVQVKRILPDEVRLVLREKAPLAQIHHYAYYQVDTAGMVISEPSAEPFAKLPVIRGIEVSERNLRRGYHLNRHAMNQVIQLLRDVRRYDILKGHELTAVDVGDRNNYLVWIDGRIEVRLSSRDFGSQLRKFADALANLDLDPDKIGYVDLRFDEIIVGPR